MPKLEVVDGNAVSYVFKHDTDPDTLYCNKKLSEVVFACPTCHWPLLIYTDKADYVKEGEALKWDFDPDSITLSPSIRHVSGMMGECGAHFFIRNGEWVICFDSKPPHTHKCRGERCEDELHGK